MIVFGEKGGGTEAPPQSHRVESRSMPAKKAPRKSAFESLLAFDRATGRTAKRERTAAPPRQGTLL